MDEFGSIRLDVNIPSQKLMSCAMLVVDEYKPLVEQALKECRDELMTDDVYKNEVKRAIKAKLHEKISKALIGQAEWIAEKAIQENASMYDTALGILEPYFNQETIKKMQKVWNKKD